MFTTMAIESLKRQVSQHLCLPFCRNYYKGWLGLSFLGNVFQWDDGTVVDYLPWDDGEPDYPETIYSYCVHQNHDVIRDASPWWSRYPVCQMEAGIAALGDDQT